MKKYFFIVLVLRFLFSISWSGPLAKAFYLWRIRAIFRMRAVRSNSLNRMHGVRRRERSSVAHVYEGWVPSPWHATCSLFHQWASRRMPAQKRRKPCTAYRAEKSSLSARWTAFPPKPRAGPWRPAAARSSLWPISSLSE